MFGGLGRFPGWRPDIRGLETFNALLLCLFSGLQSRLADVDHVCLRSEGGPLQVSAAHLRGNLEWTR